MTVADGEPFAWHGRGIRDGRVWIAVAGTATGLVYLSYLATHAYPAYGAGLYLAIAEQIAADGYGLPETIPGYTADGVPFAYPPLMFYVAAVVRAATGVGPFAYSRLIPGAVVVATVVPYYYLARELLGSSRQAGFATVLFAVTPPVLQWHLSAGGIVRAPALLLAVTGAYAGVRWFRDGRRAWLAAGTGLFGLTVLTHPTYTVFFGVTYVLLFAAFDRTVRGLVGGAVVALGGLALASPWWLQVAAVHGIDVFGGAAGTHSGLVGGPDRVYRVFVRPLALGSHLPFYVGAFAGAIYGLSRRRLFLPAWLVASGYVLGKVRFLFVAGAMLTALLLVVGTDSLRVRLPAGRPLDEMVAAFAAALVVVAAVATGAAFATGDLGRHAGSQTQPAFVDDADVEAMEWVRENTASSSTYVVLGDAAEWFPQRTDRTILVGPWGVEWTTPAEYDRQLALYRGVSRCRDADCVTDRLSTAGLRPSYVYVPKGRFTVRGFAHRRSPSMHRSMAAAPEYELAYENDGVAIYRVTDAWPDRADSSRARERPPRRHAGVASSRRA